MNQNRPLLALDIGEKRIGVATTDGVVRIARPLTTLSVDGTEGEQLRRIVEQENIEAIIVGYPRNQSGDPTQQTATVETVKNRLESHIKVPFIFQDESLTSVLAEEKLKAAGKPYEKADIDMLAAALILQDYLETNNGRI